MADDDRRFLCVTAPSPEVTHQLAAGLVTERLTAYVTAVLRVMSTYRGEGQLEQVTDVLWLIKTRRAHYTAADVGIRTHHPSDTPEIVGISAGDVTERYRPWLGQESTAG